MEDATSTPLGRATGEWPSDRLPDPIPDPDVLGDYPGSGSPDRGAPAGPPGRSRRGWVLVGVPALVLLMAVVVVARRADGPRTEVPAPTPGVESTNSTVPANLVDLPVGSPTDGLGTKMLPVRATPDKDLVDGQKVLVVGSGFPPGAFVGGVMCTGAAKTQGVAACDLTNIGYNATADAKGAFTLTFPVRRFPLINGQRVDCASGNVDPDSYARLLEQEGPHPTSSNPLAKTCIIAVGEVSNYDNSGGWPIAFQGETFLRDGDQPPVTDAPATTVGPTFVPFPAPTPAPPSTSAPLATSSVTAPPGPVTTTATRAAPPSTGAPVTTGAVAPVPGTAPG